MLGPKHSPVRATDSDCGVNLWADDRGQTLQDYLIGVSLFLVTILVIVGTILPTVTAPFEQEITSDEISQADRVAETIVANTSVGAETNRLNTTRFESLVGKDTETLRGRFGLPSTSQVNVSVVALDGAGLHRSDRGIVLATDSDPSGSDTAASARLVTLSDDSCATACRLVVRVW